MMLNLHVRLCRWIQQLLAFLKQDDTRLTNRIKAAPSWCFSFICQKYPYSFKGQTNVTNRSSSAGLKNNWPVAVYSSGRAISSGSPSVFAIPQKFNTSSCIEWISNGRFIWLTNCNHSESLICQSIKNLPFWLSLKKADQPNEVEGFYPSPPLFLPRKNDQKSCTCQAH